MAPLRLPEPFSLVPLNSVGPGMIPKTSGVAANAPVADTPVLATLPVASVVAVPPVVEVPPVVTTPPVVLPGSTPVIGLVKTPLLPVNRISELCCPQP